jgi:hypothetical protein
MDEKYTEFIPVIRLAGALAPSGSGTFPVARACDIMMPDNSRLDDYLDNMDVGGGGTGSAATGIPIVTTTGSGSAYKATVPGITELKKGINIIMIPHIPSTAYTPTLDVNGLGAKQIRRYATKGTGDTLYSGIRTKWLSSYPHRLMYDGAGWIVTELPKPSAIDLDGRVPIESGGVPEPTTDDTNKVLAVGEDGRPKWMESRNMGGSSGGLPDYTDADNGKFLQLVDGSPSWVLIEDGNGVEY